MSTTTTAEPQSKAMRAAFRLFAAIERCDVLNVPGGFGTAGAIPQSAALGDSPNDLAMLEWSGTSYAMANGHPSVRALADHVAPSNEEDGVAAVLERVFGL